MEYTDDEVEKAFAKFINLAIEEAELICEKGDPLKAAGELTHIINLLNQSNHQSLMARALSHRIVCCKNLFKNERLSVYLDLFAKDIERGLSMALRPNEKAVFYLRAGDLALFERRFDDADSNYEIACRVVPKGNREEAEYLGHWAEAKIIAGDYFEATSLLHDAYQILKTDRQVRPFHRLIIKSGLNRKLFWAAFSANHRVSSYKYFLKWAYGAIVLKTIYKMPQRWMDLKQELKY